jgi:hypothetical protein
MSVGIAIAHALAAPCPALKIAKINAGKAIPPMAAKTGRAAFRGFLNSPSANSLFISKPIKKEKLFLIAYPRTKYIFAFK